MARKLNIIYDVDDVLNNLNNYVFTKLGLLDNMPKLFNIRDCTQYSTDVQDKILALYGDPNTFKNLKLVPGASEICEIEKTGKALVFINSRNYTTEIADIKMEMLLAGIPGLFKDRIDMQIGLGEHKDPTEFADIVVEDCFGNLLKYPKNTFKILINKSHNQAEAYNTTDTDHSIIRVNDLIEANDVIRSIVDKYSMGE